MALQKDQLFDIEVELPQTNKKESLKVRHVDETFEVEINNEIISLLNNGDNTWSTVNEKLDQETVNLIGEQIEKHYNSQQL